MFFLTKSVMSRIEPFSTASPMFCESRIGMSKFVLRAANWVKIASCHCAFGTVLTFTVTFGRVFVYSLPSSSRACAGGHSNHRNVSVMSLSDSLPVSAAALLPPPPLSLLPPHATSAHATAMSAAAHTTWSLDLIRSSSERLSGGAGSNPSRFQRDATAILHHLSTNLQTSCTVVTVRPMATTTARRHFDVVDPATGAPIESLESAGPEDGLAAVAAAAAAAGEWAARAPRERAEILRRAFDLMT